MLKTENDNFCPIEVLFGELGFFGLFLAKNEYFYPHQETYFCRYHESSGHWEPLPRVPLMEESKGPHIVEITSIMPANLFVLNKTTLEFHGRVTGQPSFLPCQNSPHLLTECRLPLTYNFDVEQRWVKNGVQSTLAITILTITLVHAITAYNNMHCFFTTYIDILVIAIYNLRAKTNSRCKMMCVFYWNVWQM